MKHQLCLLSAVVVMPLLAWAGPAHAQNIYKCVTGGHVTYTDQPCARGNGELLHQADAAETIDHYLRLGQPQLAAAWAKARHLDSLYAARLALYRDAQTAKAEQAKQDALAAQAAEAQAREDQQQRLLAAQVSAQNAQTDALQAENTQLRTQNAAYQSELAQPGYYLAGPAYFGGWNAGYRGPHGHRPGTHWPAPPAHQTPPPVKGYPVLQTCAQTMGSHARC